MAQKEQEFSLLLFRTFGEIQKISQILMGISDWIGATLQGEVPALTGLNGSFARQLLSFRLIFQFLK